MKSVSTCQQLGLVEDPVIAAIARLEFDDGLRMVVLPAHCSKVIGKGGKKF